MIIIIIIMIIIIMIIIITIIIIAYFGGHLSVATASRQILHEVQVPCM